MLKSDSYKLYVYQFNSFCPVSPYHHFKSWSPLFVILSPITPVLSANSCTPSITTAFPPPTSDCKTSFTLPTFDTQFSWNCLLTPPLNILLNTNLSLPLTTCSVPVDHVEPSFRVQVTSATYETSCSSPAVETACKFYRSCCGEDWSTEVGGFGGWVVLVGGWFW